MKLVKPILASLLLIASLHAAAQDTRALTLDQAIQLSLQNNKQLKLSREKVTEATAALRQAQDNRLPDVKASGSYLRMNNPTVDLKLKLGNPQSSSSGTSSEAQSNPLSNIKIDQAAYGIASASLPLFSGFGIHYGIESAKYLEKAAEMDAANDREAVIQNTINAYSNVVKAKLSAGMISDNLRQARRRVADFKNMLANGTLVRNDLLKAELEVSNVALSLLDAENNLKMADINMSLMLGLPEHTEIMPDTDSFQSLYDAGSIADWEQVALQSRQDVAALAMREKAAISNIKAARGNYYPGIALTGNYIAADVPGLLTITNSLGIGIGVKYTLSSLWKTGAKIAQAESREHQILINEDMLNDQVRIQINQAYQDYSLSLKKIDVYAEAVQQASENYNITQSRYDNKVVTTTDLLDADMSQLQARLNYAFAKIDAMVAYKKLQLAAGILTDKQNISAK